MVCFFPYQIFCFEDMAIHQTNQLCQLHYIQYYSNLPLMFIEQLFSNTNETNLSGTAQPLLVIVVSTGLALHCVWQAGMKNISRLFNKTYVCVDKKQYGNCHFLLNPNQNFLHLQDLKNNNCMYYELTESPILK